MKKILSFAGALLFLGSLAFAQQGYYSAAAPAQYANYPGTSTWELCTTSQSVTACAASPVAITSDAAGVTSITEPANLYSGGRVVFFAPPGLYNILWNNANAPNANYLQPAMVLPDVAGNVALNDGYFTVPPSACTAGTTGTVGTGNTLIVLDGSVPAIKAAATSAASSHEVFNCVISVPSRLTTGKGITIRDLTVLYSVQTTTATSMVTPTLTSFVAPVAGTSESASNATLVAAAGGALTMTPAVASANLTAVSAGQYYSEKIALGTPLSVVTDLTEYILNFEIDQSASAAQIVTVPGVIVHYSINAM